MVENNFYYLDSTMLYLALYKSGNDDTQAQTSLVVTIAITLCYPKKTKKH